MNVIIDRFEGEFAVVELQDGKLCNMPICLVPEGASEGSVIEISCCDADSENREKRIRGKMDKLFGI